MATVVCDSCGVRLSESSMKFHRQVCGNDSHGAPRPQGRPPSPQAGRPVSAQSQPQASAVHPRAAPQNSGQPGSQLTKEEMRRNLNALREEVYGKPMPTSPSQAPHRDPVPREEPRHNQPVDEPPRRPEPRKQASYMPQARDPLPEDGIVHPAPRMEERRTPPPSNRAEPPAVVSETTRRREAELAHRLQQQEQLMQRLHEHVDELRHDMKKQRRFFEEERDKSKGTVEATPRLERDINTLGRHLNALRDEVDSWRQEAQQLHEESRQLHERALTPIAPQREHDSVPPSEGGPTRAEFEELRRVTLQMETQLQHAKGEIEELRRERDTVTILRRDMKYLRKEINTAQGEINHLRRRLELEAQPRRSEERAPYETPGRRTPQTSRVETKNASTSPIRNSPPRAGSEPRPIVVQQGRRPPSVRDRPLRDRDEGPVPSTHVVGGSDRRRPPGDDRRTPPQGRVSRQPSVQSYFSTDEEGYQRHHETETLVSRAVRGAYDNPRIAYDDEDSYYSDDYTDEDDRRPPPWASAPSPSAARVPPSRRRGPPPRDVRERERERDYGPPPPPPQGRGPPPVTHVSLR